MAVGSLSFSGQIDTWTRETKARQTAVFRGSAQELCSRIQAGVPVDTGFLRSSFAVARNAPLPPGNVQQGGALPAGSIAAVIANADIGDVINAGYVAAYAMRVHYGFVGTDAAGRDINQSPNPWVLRASMDWPQIVSGEVAKAKASVASRSR